MKNKIKNITVVIAAGAIFTLLSCKPPQNYPTPVGYNLNKPQKFYMPDNLEEISGIAFNNGKSDLLYAEEDENGRVYYMKLGDKKAKFATFKETGDFEDMAIAGNQIIMLQSKGRLYTFPLADVSSPKITNVQKFENILPKGEYEGMYANPQTKQVYVMCKHCDVDKTSKQTSGYIFQMGDNGALMQSDEFKINVKHIADQLNDDKVNFHPSALAQNPRSKEWYVLSSVNKLLVILNEKFKVMQVFKLNPGVFPQPEGITFDAQNNLYISNEGDKIDPGTVLKFAWTGK